MKNATIGFAMCGSYCTFSKAIEQMKKLVDLGYNVLPIMSGNAYSTDTRFGESKEFVRLIESITDNKVIHTIKDAEPIGPKKMCDLILIAPCTGNTLAKLAGGITDTSVTMAAKSHLRILRPVLIALATNDALGASAQNIGTMLNRRNIYFVPLGQDDSAAKPSSMVADFTQIPAAVEMALEHKQIQPVFL
ncbi:MAG: dipicolinate synthase subunit B [Lachnospiraceae bacterium]|nr:dipicolinate synthase subunit B [Lachnospiraceae bacterium]